MGATLPPVVIEERESAAKRYQLLEEALRLAHPLRNRAPADLSRARDSLVAQVARDQQVPVLLALGLARTENTGGVPWAVSPTGDVGLLQLNQRAQGYSPEVLADRRANVTLGLNLLRRLYDRSGSWDTALKQYHLGPTGAKRHPKTGAGYVERVREAMRHVNRTRSGR